MSPVDSAAPTNEVGQAAPSLMGGVLPWGGFAGDELEHVAELQWPVSSITYNLMRTDSQIQGLLAGATLPIRRYAWHIDPNGARDEVVQLISDDIGLPIKGTDPNEPRGRSKRRFSFDKHVFHALLALAYGHMYFEQVGEVRDDGLWHLRKLAPRMPLTIAEVKTEVDGGLKYIKQNVGWKAPEIPVNRLIAYVWDQEGANWVGRSLLRAAYKNWLVKDRLLRVDAINHERAGGVPYATAPLGASNEQIKALDRMARAFKVGESAGGALPHGAELKIAGGKSSDVINSLRFHNEEMARSFLMMFMQLGQTETGSRALGESFIDYFQLAQETIGYFIRDTFNEHQIEDQVDWNWGEDEPAPLLDFDRDDGGGDDGGGDPAEDAADALVEQIDEGNVQVDSEVEASIRIRASRDKHTSRRSNGAERRGRVAAEAVPPLPLPPRPLRRQPYDHEIRAAVDFAIMDSLFESTAEQAVREVANVQASQIADLGDGIIDAAGDLDAITTIKASPVSEDILFKHMSSIAEQGAHQAVQEAQRQGYNIMLPDVTKQHTALRARARATDQLLADSLSETARRQAIQRTGGSLTPVQVAGQTRAHLNGLSDQYLRDQIGGTLNQAQNTGRRQVFNNAPEADYYASELLDSATCPACTAKDGTQYTSVEDAEQDYPTGGYRECRGGPRCRGTLVAVYKGDSGESEATL